MTPHSSHPNESFAERLRFWRVSQNLTRAKAASSGQSRPRLLLPRVERGRSPGNALATRFLLIEKSSSVKVNGNVAAAYGLRNLPVLSWTQAGRGRRTFERNPPPTGTKSCETTFPTSRLSACVCATIRWSPKFSDGDIAILLPGTAPTNGEIVMANLKNQGAFCKIMQVQLDKNLVKLSSYNPAYPPTEYHREEFHWIFPVASIIKQLRRK